MSWVRSSEIVELHPARGSAVTESGRRYSLGRRFRPGDVAAEGEEAWLAFLMLVGRLYPGHVAIPEPGTPTHGGSPHAKCRAISG